MTDHSQKNETERKRVGFLLAVFANLQNLNKADNMKL